MQAGQVLYQVEADVPMGIWVIIPFGECSNYDDARAAASIQLDYAKLDGKEVFRVRMIQATVSVINDIHGIL